MTKNQILHIRVNDEVKARAEKTLEALGLSISEAVNMYLHQISIVGGIPYEVRLPAPESVTFKNEEELVEMVMEGYRSMREGRMISGEEMFEEIRRKYGFSI
ncbi:MAG: type II toxin-antitoxin system RelB/DinJ family antitoxin [Oscillospiraceae bacterium]|nr:type II toxin-antitoxin system RelB/DinJ family antitoxin [Oscillospiraceae bacterium]